MVRSIIVAFDGKGLVLANASLRVPSMQVRVVVASMEDNTLAATLEMWRADPAVAAIVGGLATRYDTILRPLENRPGYWKGNVMFRDAQQLRGHPVYDALLDFVPQATAAVLFFEGGVGLLRLDTDGSLAGTKIAAALAAWPEPPAHFVEVQEGLPSIDAWQPGPEWQMLRQRVAET